MKQLEQILVAIFVLIVITSCDNDDNEEKKLLLNEASLSAKWLVTGINDYESLEFTENGYYIVTENAVDRLTTRKIAHFGEYDITDSETVTLSDFGSIHISYLDESLISFSLQLTSVADNEITVNARKQEEIDSTLKTDLLCQTWEMVSFDGYAIPEFVLLFSKAGTYLCDAIVDGKRKTEVGTWSWCDSEESKLSFSLDNFLDCSGRNIFKNIQLTSESFIATDMENGEPMEMVMRPLVKH